MPDTPGPSLAFPFGVLLILGGLVALLFKPGIGVVLIVVGIIVLYAGYKAQGGAANPNLNRDPEEVQEEWRRKYDA